MPLRIYSSSPAFHEQYLGRLCEDAANALPEAVGRMRRHVPRFAGLSEAEVAAKSPSVGDARATVAGEHGFGGWAAFVERLQAIAEAPDAEPFCAFIHAVEAGDAAQVEAALDRHPDMVNAVASTAKTPLHSAGSAEVARLLLERGADPAIETPLPGGTALAHALVWGAREIAEVIAERCRAPGNLRVAAGLGDLDALRAMRDASGGLTAAATAGRDYYRPNYGWYSWQTGDGVQEVLDEGLVYAATNGRIDAMRMLVDFGAQVDGKVYGTTALLRAAWKGRREAIDWLLDHGADVNAQGWLGGHAKGATALHIVASNGDVELVRQLLARGATAAARDSLYQSTPKGWAEFHRQPIAAALLD